VVALAVLMPIVASMGGVAGTQVLTLMVRGLALGQVGVGNLRALLAKEVLVGCSTADLGAGGRRGLGAVVPGSRAWAW
jgi:Mg/Co/Ni transporter MgtE